MSFGAGLMALALLVDFVYDIELISVSSCLILIGKLEIKCCGKTIHHFVCMNVLFTMDLRIRLR